MALGSWRYSLLFIMTKTELYTSGATSLLDLDLQETYRAIDSVATGSIPSLFCDIMLKRPMPATSGI